MYLNIFSGELGTARVLDRVELSISQGEFFVLLGPSGGGKSTLLQVIAGLIPYRGRIFFDGRCVDGKPLSP